MKKSIQMYAVDWVWIVNIGAVRVPLARIPRCLQCAGGITVVLHKASWGRWRLASFRFSWVETGIGCGGGLWTRHGEEVWVWVCAQAAQQILERCLELWVCCTQVGKVLGSTQHFSSPWLTEVLLRKRCSVERQGVAVLGERMWVGGAGLILRVLWRSWGASFLPGNENKGPPASDGKAWLRLEVTVAWVRQTDFHTPPPLFFFLRAIFSYCSEHGALLATYTTHCAQNLNRIKVSNFHLVFIHFGWLSKCWVRHEKNVPVIISDGTRMISQLEKY